MDVLFRLFGNLHARGEEGWQRLIYAWKWFNRQIFQVQLAVIADLLCMFGGITLTVLFESNKPARYTFIPCMLLGAYIVRKLSLPVWFYELAVSAIKRGASVLPKEIKDWLNLPAPSAHEVHSGQQVVWHETSEGGHIFHVIGTVWMWLHVVLYACGWFPVWKSDWMSFVVMATSFILFFVWTEDFVNIKRWRTVLAVVVGTHVAVMILIMIFAAAAPGTFENVAAKFRRHEAVQQTEADAANTQTGDDKTYLASLHVQERQFKAMYRKHLRDANGRKGVFDADWSADNAAEQTTVASQIEQEISQPEDEETINGWTTSAAEFPEEHPGWLIVAGIALLAIGKKATSTSAH